MINELLQLNDLLYSIGLTKSESKVYISLLELGKASSGEILENAKMNSGKIYEILNSLKNKGFVGELIENGVKKFIPSDPSRIYEYLNKKNEQIAGYKKSLNNLLPTILNKLSSKKQEIKIEVYTGFEAYKIVSLKEVKRYKKQETLYVFGVLRPEKYTKKVDDFFIHKIQPERLRKKIKIKKIFSEEARHYKPYIEKASKVRYLPYNSPLTINIIKDLTILEIFAEEIIMITIESESIAKSFIQQFEIMWKIAKK
jgi:sugar-specific transcriptional regulator TrmB